MNTQNNSIQKLNIKLLGKKLQRFEPTLSNNIKNIKAIPTLSRSTLTQIEKIFKNKKLKATENDAKTMEDKYSMPELSLKEQYEALLNRNELLLPPKYRLLLKKQNHLDIILSTHNINQSLINTNDINKNKENFFHSYNNIQDNFIKSIHMSFSNNDFQKILFVCPFYYIYQSVYKLSKGIELKFIDIPDDYIQRMNKKYNMKTNFILLQTPKKYEPLKGEINKNIMEKRSKLFKKILINITLEQHQKFLKDHNIPLFDPMKCCTWHHNFDLKNVKDIELFNLVENNIKEYKALGII